MSYRRHLLKRYDRRDRLSMVLIGVSLAFLTGSALLFVSATQHVQAIAADYGTTGFATVYPSLEAAARAGTNGTAFSLSHVNLGGTNVTVLGVPPTANDTYLAATPERGFGSAVIDVAHTGTVTGVSALDSVQLAPRPALPVIPDEWYLARQSLVQRLGPDDALVIESGTRTFEQPQASAQSVPLRGAARFFVAGTRQTLTLFGVVVAGVAGLVGIIVFSVTRLSIQDRSKTIRIARATGATPRQITALFTARAAIVTGIGIALGYAIGVIAARLAVNVSVFLGVPVSLNLSLSWASLRVLLPMYGIVLLLGSIAGYLATRSIRRVPPADIQSPHDGSDRSNSSLGDRLPAVFDLSVLRWRSIIPTIGTMTVFVGLLILLASTATVITPIVDAEAATIAEPDAVHPVASDVPESFGGTLAEYGIEASPEILLFPSVDGTSVLARGVEFPAFANVTGATLTSGRAPANGEEAVVGAALARRHGFRVGETVTVGGSTASALTQVTIVGIFDGPQFYDNHLLVSLPTARHLSSRAPGRVNVVRADRLPETAGSGIRVVSVEAPTTNPATEAVRVRLTAVNLGETRTTRAVSVDLANDSRQFTFDIPPGGQSTRSVTLPAPDPGTWQLRAGSITHSVTVRHPDALTVSVPNRVPAGSAPRVTVRTVSGAPVANATVSVGTETGRTNEGGVTRLTVPATADHFVVTAGDRQVRTPVTVLTNDSTEQRQPVVSLSIAPPSPSFQIRPTATVRIENPWRQSLATELHIDGPDRQLRRSVTLDGGARTTLRETLARQSPGEYEVTVTASDGTVLASQSFEVTGNERLIAALATHGERTSTPFSQAVSVIFGNLTLLIGAVIALGALMTAGGLTAIFSRGVHSRRRTIGIYRATGATPRQLYGLVLREAAVIGATALLVAFPLSYLLLRALASLGLLTTFGIHLHPILDVGTVGIGSAIALGLVLLGATLATATLLESSPAATLVDDTATGGLDR